MCILMDLIHEFDCPGFSMQCHKDDGPHTCLKVLPSSSLTYSTTLLELAPVGTKRDVPSGSMGQSLGIARYIYIPCRPVDQLMMILKLASSDKQLAGYVSTNVRLGSSSLPYWPPSVQDMCMLTMVLSAPPLANATLPPLSA